MARAPGEVRDAILRYFETHNEAVSVREIRGAVSDQLGEVSPSSVRSYLNLNVPNLFVRIGRGCYRLTKKAK
jgi:hypothetical protein